VIIEEEELDATPQRTEKPPIIPIESNQTTLH